MPFLEPAERTAAAVATATRFPQRDIAHDRWADPDRGTPEAPARATMRQLIRGDLRTSASRWHLMSSTTSRGVHCLRSTTRSVAPLRLALAAACLVASGCGHSRDFLWVNEVPASAASSTDDTYRISRGDIIGVRVWNQESMSIERARVREDGKISLPFLNDVEVAGMEPAELGRRLEVKLKAFVVNPVVTVLVQERMPTRVSVVGEVTRPGTYDLEKGAGVLQAIAAAGGTTAFAHDSGVYVLRSGYWADGNPAPGRIRFRYSDLRQGRAPAAAFHLRVGDVVVVE